jgi:predicted phosphate transport protein (TIGR00153 family)
MPRLRLRLFPRDEGFFELFVKQAEQIEAAAEQLHDLVSNFEDVPGKAARLHDLEHEGDETTHEIMRRLNTTFVTPLDHEDIYRLASTLDDVLDHLDAAADLFVLHKIEAPLPEMKVQTDALVRAAKATREALATLPKYSALAQFWVEINRLENEGDRIYRRATADLFGGDFKAMDVLKWKDIIDELEGAMDRMEDVANILESIALKNA